MRGVFYLKYKIHLFLWGNYREYERLERIESMRGKN